MTTWKNAAPYAVDIPRLGVKDLAPGQTIEVDDGQTLSPPMELVKSAAPGKPASPED